MTIYHAALFLSNPSVNNVIIKTRSIGSRKPRRKVSDSRPRQLATCVSRSYLRVSAGVNKISREYRSADILRKASWTLDDESRRLGGRVSGNRSAIFTEHSVEPRDHSPRPCPCRRFTINRGYLADESIVRDVTWGSWRPPTHSGENELYDRCHHDAHRSVKVLDARD